jgi:predicted 3-demethylubiquinone-9 3-methyltransferase (glyoxalase superfamily)
LEEQKAFQRIIPFLWFDSQAEQAAEFYTRVFANSAITRRTFYGEEGTDVHGREPGSLMKVEFELEGQTFMALNGGPLFNFTPAISFFISCQSFQEIDQLWEKLLDGGSVVMQLGPYEWSRRYGRVQDKFGISWQLNHEDASDAGQKIVPCILFSGHMAGKGEEAINKYVGLFENSFVKVIEYDVQVVQDHARIVKYCLFTVDCCSFMLMETHTDHGFELNESISFIVRCQNQQQIDYYWDELSREGPSDSQQCGWLKDKFGISWQVVPEILNDLLDNKDTEKVNHVTSVMLNMKKLIIDELLQAYEKRIDANF